MLFKDLESTVGPAVTLLLVGLKIVGQQAMAVAAVGVMREAGLQQPQAEFGVLANRIAPPAADQFKRGAANKHIVPCTTMASSSFRCTMPISKKPEYRDGEMHEQRWPSR